MRIKCIGNNGSYLDKITLQKSGDLKTVEYPIKIGDEYVVYGQMIYDEVLYYLIKGTYEDLPSWYPAELFEVTNNLIYMEWYFRFDSKSELSAIWGYWELVFSLEHYNGLIDREKKDIKIFLDRKKEIDEFS